MVQVRTLQPVIAQGHISIGGWVEQLKATVSLRNTGPVEKACKRVQALAKQAQPATRDEPDYLQGNCFYAGLEIAEILAGLKLDCDSLVAGILCRAVLESRLSLEAVEAEFGESVRQLLDGVLQMEAISSVRQPLTAPVLGSRYRQVDNVRKMLVALVDDVRLALIKLAERTWAIRAVKNAPQDFKQAMAREVSEIYAPLAHRLGIGYIKWELEDIAFRYLEPERYVRIARLLDGRRLDREAFIASVINLLEARLRAEQIEAAVTGRAKHIYSIARKMEKKHIDFDQVYDISAVRVLVANLRDCYAALGVVHALWQHIPREFDDYIATPKANGYRSLHTAVIGPEGKVMEVQIRTHEMHREAEFGVCSHWQYKGADRKGVGHSYEEKIDWLRQILQWHEEVGDISSLAEELKLDVETDRIYVFTPAGHVVDLLQGATPVDFAYRVHTEVGNHCRGARVNGAIVPLNHSLRTGDQVEILTAEHATPRREWLNPALGYIRVARTRTKIKHWFKLQDKEVNADAGLVMIEHELQRLALTDVDFNALVAAMGYESCEEMFADVGAGELSVAGVMDVLQQQLSDYAVREQLLLQFPADQFQTSDTGPREQVAGLLPGEDAISKLAECCQPIKGEACLGYIQQGYGVVVHRRDCEEIVRLAEEDPERIVQVNWDGPSRSSYAIDLLVRALDRPGLLHDITSVLNSESINVLALNSRLDRREGLVELCMTIEVTGLVLLGRVLDKIGQLPNLVEVKRCAGGGQDV